MFIKKVWSLIYSFFFLVSFSSFSFQKDHAHVHEWITTYIDPGPYLAITPTDLQIITNLCYFSYLRSASTLVAQKCALKALKATWQGLQNIASLRMNPSKDLAYIPLDDSLQTTYYQEFIDAQKMHRRLGSIYAELSNQCVKTNLLSKNGQAAVKALRTQSRTMIMHTFATLKNIQDQIKACINMLNASPTTKKPLLETAWSFIAASSVPSFLELEKITLHAQDATWNVLENLIGLNMHLWDFIETTRCDYYQSYYQALLHVMKKYALEPEYATILYSSDGLTDHADIGKKLPLHLSFKILDNWHD